MVEWILESFPPEDRKRFIETTERVDTPEAKHGKPLHKGLDTSIMEIADDIAYGVHDMEDAIALNMLKERDCEGLKQIIPDDLQQGGELITALFSNKKYEAKHAIGALVNYFITRVSLRRKEDFEHP